MLLGIMLVYIVVRDHSRLCSCQGSCQFMQLLGIMLVYCCQGSCQFSNLVVADFPMMSSLALRSQLAFQYQSWFLFSLLQLEICSYACHHCTLKVHLTMLIYRHHGWIRMWVTSFLQKLTLCLLVPRELVLREGEFRSFSVQRSPDLFFKCMRSSTIETYFPPPRGKPRATTICCMIWESLGQPWPNLKKKKSFHIWYWVVCGCWRRHHQSRREKFIKTIYV